MSQRRPTSAFLPALVGAKNEQAAVERYRERIQESLATVSKSATWYRSRREDGSWLLLTTPQAVELLKRDGTPLYLFAAQGFVPEQSRPLGGFKVRTIGYSYSIGLSDSPSDARLAWHWHPDMGPAHAHSHLYFEDADFGRTNRWHMPTSRVFFEQVIAFCVESLDVQASDDCFDVLARVQAGVEAAASWRGAKP